MTHMRCHRRGTAQDFETSPDCRDRKFAAKASGSAHKSGTPRARSMGAAIGASLRSPACAITCAEAVFRAAQPQLFNRIVMSALFTTPSRFRSAGRGPVWPQLFISRERSDGDTKPSRSRSPGSNSQNNQEAEALAQGFGAYRPAPRSAPRPARAGRGAHTDAAAESNGGFLRSTTARALTSSARLRGPIARLCAPFAPLTPLPARGPMRG